MQNRKQTGFSLPTVVALGVVASLWMLGTAQLIVPSMGHLTKERTEDMERCSAEAALDWAIQQLNNTSTRASVDNQSNLAVPSTILSGSGLQGHISIANVAAPQSSYLYDPLADSSNAAAALPPSNGWRVVTATITPQFGPGSKNVRVILKPTYAQAMNSVTTQSQGPPTPLFNFSAFAIGQVNGNGNMWTNSYDSRLTPHPTSFDNTGANVGTNGSMGFVGNAFIGGNMDVWSAPGMQDNVVAQGTSNVYVNGSIDANGQVSDFNNVSGQITEGDNHAQQQLPATPTAPAGSSTSLGAINLSGNSRMTLTAGNYVVNSISITGNAQLNIDSSAGPVNIYVQGAGSNDGIAIAGNGIYNGGLPANLRIWYPGTGPTQIGGNGNFTGVVYAPNSNVTIMGNGQQYGAMVGNTINFNGNGTFHYDRALAANNQLMWNPPVYTTTTTVTNYLAFFQAVSWEEF